MQRFVLRQNLTRFRNLLAQETNETRQKTLRSLICVAQRQLASLDSAESGVLSPGSASAGVSRDYRRINEFEREFQNSSHPYLVLDPRPGLHIVDINDAYARATMTNRAGVSGEPMFHVFPDNPDDYFADGVNNLYASLSIAATSGRPHAMMVQRYDIRDPNGKFVERYWRPVNTPLCDENGRLIFLLHHVEDVTSDVVST